MEPIKCFWVEPTGRTFYYRTSYSQEACAVRGSKHSANSAEQLEPFQKGTLGPTTCACGYEFTAEERYGGGGERKEYRRVDTGEVLDTRHHHFPVGAMWDAEWLKHEGIERPSDKPRAWHLGADGRILTVMTPGGEWIIDSRCSNCTMPEDNEHRCWVRHGEPPNITVDKNGLTCAAGAGSIQCGSYHGFLREGHLVQA